MGNIYQPTKAVEMTKQQTLEESGGHACQDEALLTIIISPSYLAHTMDKRTRANDNGELRARMTRIPEKKTAIHVWLFGKTWAK